MTEPSDPTVDNDPATDLGTLFRHVKPDVRIFRLRLGLLLDVLLEAWCKETAAPLVQDAWSPRNPARGQCAVTALVVQDIFGGSIVRADLGKLGSHYWNVIERCQHDVAIDLTRRQFPSGLSSPSRSGTK